MRKTHKTLSYCPKCNEDTEHEDFLCLKCGACYTFTRKLKLKNMTEHELKELELASKLTVEDRAKLHSLHKKLDEFAFRDSKEYDRLLNEWLQFLEIANQRLVAKEGGEKSK